MRTIFILLFAFYIFSFLVGCGEQRIYSTFQAVYGVLIEDETGEVNLYQANTALHVLATHFDCNDFDGLYITMQWDAPYDPNLNEWMDGIYTWDDETIEMQVHDPECIFTSALMHEVTHHIEKRCMKLDVGDGKSYTHTQEYWKEVANLNYDLYKSECKTKWK